MPPRLVAIRLPPAAFVSTLRDVWAAGDAVLPLPAPDWRGGDDVAVAAIARWRPDIIVDPDGQQPGPGGARANDGTAAVVATSGSTAHPKAVVLSHTALDASTSRSVAALGAKPGDRFLLTLPLHHVAGLQVVRRAWACGTDPVVGTELDFGGSHDDARMHVSLVAAQLDRLLEHGIDGSHLGSVLVGGGPVDTSLLTRATAAGLDVRTSYGMTETSGGCVYDGSPLPDVEVAAPDGRIRIRGPILASGYLDDPAPLCDDDGWFSTADLGQVDGGHVTVWGRADDVIVSGGENVPAAIVADALRSHPAVADAAVVGVPDVRWGAVVAAAVVVDDPSVAGEELTEYVRSRVPAAWLPRRLIAVAALPRTTLAKVDTRAVRALLTETAIRE